MDVLTIGLGLIGKYDSFKDFMKDIEASFPLMDVSKITFSVGGEKTGEEEVDLTNPILDIGLVLETYYTERR